MTPPLYADMGKQARDVFRKGFHMGLVKIDCKTKSKSGIEFTAGEAINIETGKVGGSADVKIDFPEQGLTLTERWSTDNVITCEVAADNALTKGLKLSGIGTFAPFTGVWNVVAKGQFKHDNATVNIESDFFKGPNLTGGLVVGYKGFLAGYYSSFDCGLKKRTKANLSLGYIMKDVAFNLACEGDLYTGSVHHVVNPNLEAAMTAGFNNANSLTSMELGTRYIIDKESSIRTKIDQNARVSTSYEQRLRPGVTMTFCTQMDLKNLNQGGHKIGMGIDLEA